MQTILRVWAEEFKGSTGRASLRCLVWEQVRFKDFRVRPVHLRIWMLGSHSHAVSLSAEDVGCDAGSLLQFFTGQATEESRIHEPSRRQDLQKVNRSGIWRWLCGMSIFFVKSACLW